MVGGRLDRGLVGDVDLDDQRLATFGVDLGRDLFELVIVARKQRDVSTCLRE